MLSSERKREEIERKERKKIILCERFKVPKKGKDKRGRESQKEVPSVLGFFQAPFVGSEKGKKAFCFFARNVIVIVQIRYEAQIFAAWHFVFAFGC